jgi:hypothetical protein
VLFHKPLNVGATIQQFAVEHPWRELPLDLCPPMAVRDAGVISGLVHREIVFAGEHVQGLAHAGGTSLSGHGSRVMASPSVLMGIHTTANAHDCSVCRSEPACMVVP